MNQATSQIIVYCYTGVIIEDMDEEDSITYRHYNRNLWKYILNPSAQNTYTCTVTFIV